MTKFMAWLITAVNVVVAIALWLDLRDLARRDIEVSRRESALRWLENREEFMLPRTRQRTRARWN